LSKVKICLVCLHGASIKQFTVLELKILVSTGCTYPHLESTGIFPMLHRWTRKIIPYDYHSLKTIFQRYV